MFSLKSFHFTKPPQMNFWEFRNEFRSAPKFNFGASGSEINFGAGSIGTELPAMAPKLISEPAPEFKSSMEKASKKLRVLSTSHAHDLPCMHSIRREGFRVFVLNIS